MSIYRPLFSLDENLYAETSPVLIETGKLFLNTETGLLHIQIKLKRLSFKAISIVKAEFNLMDSIGREIGRYEQQYLDINAKLNESFGSKIPVYLNNNSTRKFSVAIKEVCFTDGTVWELASNTPFEAIPPAKNLTSTLSSSAIDEFKIIHCKNAQFVPLRHKDLWRCSCGNFNKSSNEKCTACNANLVDMESIDAITLAKDNVYRQAKNLVNSTKSQEIAKGLSLFKNIVDWKDSQKQIEEGDEKYTSALKKERAATFLANKAKKKKKFYIISSCIGAFTLILTICIVSATVKSNKYNRAQEYLSQHNYKEARSLLDDLNGYKDANDLYLLADYMVSGQYKKAIEKFKLTEIHIPEGTKRIADKAFTSCKTLKKIYLPNSVTEIGKEAFSSCTANIIWGNNPKITNISENAFKSYGGTNITIPNSVTKIEKEAFDGCSNLTSVEIPNSVTTIGENAFYGCYDLTSVYYNGDIEGWCNISLSEGYRSNPLSYGAKLYINGNLATNIVIPNNVTKINDYTFHGCSSLTSVVIGDSVKTIGKNAFYNCSSLKSVVIPNSVTMINISTFSGCSSLTSVKIPDSITIIGKSAFYDCSSLKSVVIPNSVYTIGSSAFSGCSSLTSVVIPNSVTTIGEYAFSGCSSLQSITLPFIGGSRYASSVSSSTLFGYIFGGLEYTGSYRACQYYSYSNYSNYYIPSSLKEVIITGGREILRGAFYNCSSLTSVVIPDSVTKIGQEAFYNCKNLKQIKYKGSSSQWSAITKGSYWDCYYYSSYKDAKINYTITYNYKD